MRIRLRRTLNSKSEPHRFTVPALPDDVARCGSSYCSVTLIFNYYYFDFTKFGKFFNDLFCLGSGLSQNAGSGFKTIRIHIPQACLNLNQYG
jgi:hypothetical protein